MNSSYVVAQVSTLISPRLGVGLAWSEFLFTACSWPLIGLWPVAGPWEASAVLGSSHSSLGDSDEWAPPSAIVECEPLWLAAACCLFPSPHNCRLKCVEAGGGELLGLLKKQS